MEPIIETYYMDTEQLDIEEMRKEEREALMDHLKSAEEKLKKESDPTLQEYVDSIEKQLKGGRKSRKNWKSRKNRKARKSRKA